MTNTVEVTAYITDTFLSDSGIENISDMDNEQREDLADEIELAERGIKYLADYQYTYFVDVMHIDLFNENQAWEDADIEEHISTNFVDASSWSKARVLQFIGEKLD